MAFSHFYSHLSRSRFFCTQYNKSCSILFLSFSSPRCVHFYVFHIIWLLLLFVFFLFLFSSLLPLLRFSLFFIVVLLLFKFLGALAFDRKLYLVVKTSAKWEIIKTYICIYIYTVLWRGRIKSRKSINHVLRIQTKRPWAIIHPHFECFLIFSLTHKFPLSSRLFLPFFFNSFTRTLRKSTGMFYHRDSIMLLNLICATLHSQPFIFIIVLCCYYIHLQYT